MPGHLRLSVSKTECLIPSHCPLIAFHLLGNREASLGSSSHTTRLDPSTSPWLYSSELVLNWPIFFQTATVSAILVMVAAGIFARTALPNLQTGVPASAPLLTPCLFFI